MFTSRWGDKVRYGDIAGGLKAGEGRLGRLGEAQTGPVVDGFRLGANNEEI
jgi:hypothetical protein